MITPPSPTTPPDANHCRRAADGPAHRRSALGAHRRRVGADQLPRDVTGAVAHRGEVAVLAGEGGTLAGRDLVSVSELFDDPLAIEERQRMVDDGAGGLISTTFKMPVWYRKPPDAQMSGTPMCAALDYARRVRLESPVRGRRP